MTEIWRQWNPANSDNIIFNAEYAIIKDDEKGLTIQLKDDENHTSIKFVFENHVFAYQCIDEGKRLKMLNLLEKNYNTNFYLKWPLFQIENSNYLKWFNNENYNIYQENEIKHYVFLTSNDVIDVLSNYEPIISK